MKQFFLALIVVVGVVSMVACNKDDEQAPYDPIAQAVIDEAVIVKHIQDKSLTGFIRDTTGVYYKKLQTAGTSTDTITIQDRMVITYVGNLLNGTKFDEGTQTSLRDAKLKDLIPGWQIGLRKIAKGDKIALLIPSTLAYRNRSAGIIPANSVLYFEVTLHNFYN
jgi:FKBP-type peptidyl-prolyl cis-trans isomerase FkpA